MEKVRRIQLHRRDVFLATSTQCSLNERLAEYLLNTQVLNGDELGHLARSEHGVVIALVTFASVYLFC